ncbi:protein of unknown function DUF541 [[Leptolyngbya] sp. PCC 7376]|uniref:SIMPL domain-containing protein n=1 Tax=[Leptolyngbya] sp. PCC 7376 TaxID=111781 RepID=UPI00029F323F|nr:SIMPL domain-containing protein [[Leptolyngbya] sp. PCC 7376]AFY39654.1 protein of unknown function DUF541 [[Leptolyngbya] sp. PCC 7376]
MSRKKFWLPIFTGLICLGCTTSVIADDQATLLRTITVTGQGQEAIATSLSQVRLGVEVKGKTAEQVQADMANRSQQVVEFLKGKNVEKLTTTGINLQPQYDWSGDERRLIGYIATNTVSFEVPTESAGSIMDEAVKAGATRIDGISFRATDEAIAAAETIALGEASQDAKTQAEVVLESLGLNSQEIIQIQVNGSQPATPMPLLMRQQVSLEASDAAITPVEGGEQKVNASVTLTIRY